MAFPHEDGNRIRRYFTGKGIGFLCPEDLVRLTLHPEYVRQWEVHVEGGFTAVVDKGERQLLDLLFERRDLDEITIHQTAFDEEDPGVEIPEFTT